jgi:hypothetical protein
LTGTGGVAATRGPGWAEAIATGVPAVALAARTAITTVRNRNRRMLSPSR